MHKKLKKEVLGLITARGGSKGFPGKNIHSISGRPLIAYTIEAAINSKFISNITVSSDSDEILKIAKKFGAKTIKRPDEFAQDTSSSEDTILHALDYLSQRGEIFDILVLLQPTSPLRDAEDIDNAIKLMIDKKASGVISVTNIGVKPFKSYYLNESGFLKGVHNDKTPNMRRQDLPDAFLANGAIYAVYVNDFLNSKSLIPMNTIPYVMSKSKSIDIDTIEDVRIVEDYIKSSF
jgi:CMP-N,N'-diacetyllegionaminic acid synthase